VTYKPENTEYLGKTNVLIRLNKDDTLFLLSRIQDAVRKEAGANLILLDLSGAISETYSDERGRQIKVIAFKGTSGLTVRSDQRGYNGPWSHIEIVMPLSVCDKIIEFLIKVDPAILC